MRPPGMFSLPAVTAILAAVSLAGAGCGSDDDNDQVGAPTREPAVTETAAPETEELLEDTRNLTAAVAREAASLADGTDSGRDERLRELESEARELRARASALPADRAVREGLRAANAAAAEAAREIRTAAAEGRREQVPGIVRELEQARERLGELDPGSE